MEGSFCPLQPQVEPCQGYLIHLPATGLAVPTSLGRTIAGPSDYSLGRGGGPCISVLLVNSGTPPPPPLLLLEQRLRVLALASICSLSDYCRGGLCKILSQQLSRDA